MRGLRRQPPAPEWEQGPNDLVERSPSPQRLRPVVLRPATFQRVYRVAGYRFHSLVDVALLGAEWLVAAALALLIGYYIVDGPVRDWMYAAASAQQSVPPAQAVANARPVKTDQPARSVHPPKQAKVVEPFRPATVEVRAAVQDDLSEPELGRMLPGVEPDWRRPAVAPDYLTPARDFVPAAPLPARNAVPVVEPVIREEPPRDPRPIRLQAPDIGLDTRVVEVFLRDGVWQVADYAAGYHHGTGVPGDGNVVMAGHKGLRGAVFARLEKLKVGDEIFVDTADRRFRYRIRETGKVWPSQVSVMFPTVTPTLTLLTCTNWDIHRFVVIADLVDSAPLPASAG